MTLASPTSVNHVEHRMTDNQTTARPLDWYDRVARIGKRLSCAQERGTGCHLSSDDIQDLFLSNISEQWAILADAAKHKDNESV